MYQITTLTLDPLFTNRAFVQKAAAAKSPGRPKKITTDAAAPKKTATKAKAAAPKKAPATKKAAAPKPKANTASKRKTPAPVCYVPI